MSSAVAASNIPQATSPFEAEAIMAAAGKTFHQSTRLLPPQLRAPITLLYVFCRQVDDLADESTQSIAERSRQLGEIQLALTEDPDGQSLGVLAAQLRGLPLSSSGRLAAATLVAAAREDLQQQQPQDESGLLRYAFGVAGTVGIMMAEVLGARRQGTFAAVDLGLAMQLSNIARDVAEDFNADRVYLPAAWITRDTLASALTEGNVHAQQSLRAATLRLLSLADTLYESSLTGFWTLPLRVRWGILSAAFCYREIGVYVGKDVAASWRRRTVVPAWRKLGLIVQCSARLLLPRFWKEPLAAKVDRTSPDYPAYLPVEFRHPESTRDA